MKMKSSPQKILSDEELSVATIQWIGGRCFLIQSIPMIQDCSLPFRYCLSWTVVSSKGGMPFRMRKLLYCSELRSWVGGDYKSNLMSSWAWHKLSHKSALCRSRLPFPWLWHSNLLQLQNSPSPLGVLGLFTWTPYLALKPRSIFLLLHCLPPDSDAPSFLGNQLQKVPVPPSYHTGPHLVLLLEKRLLLLLEISKLSSCKNPGVFIPLTSFTKGSPHMWGGFALIPMSSSYKHWHKTHHI